jgi:hypothetical protein
MVTRSALFPGRPRGRKRSKGERGTSVRRGGKSSSADRRPRSPESMGDREPCGHGKGRRVRQQRRGVAGRPAAVRNGPPDNTHASRTAHHPLLDAEGIARSVRVELSSLCPPASLLTLPEAPGDWHTSRFACPGNPRRCSLRKRARARGHGAGLGRPQDSSPWAVTSPGVGASAACSLPICGRRGGRRRLLRSLPRRGWRPAIPTPHGTRVWPVPPGIAGLWGPRPSPAPLACARRRRSAVARRIGRHRVTASFKPGVRPFPSTLPLRDVEPNALRRVPIVAPGGPRTAIT